MSAVSAVEDSSFSGELPFAAGPHHGPAHRRGARHAGNRRRSTGASLPARRGDPICRLHRRQLQASKVASQTDAKYMLFCGVHFMAETADVLAKPWQQVILPDLNAGCSMADMAEIGQVENCWDSLKRAGLTGDLVPLTYMNSAAAIKAFCGEQGGLVCTSSNARGAFEWAFARASKILFPSRSTPRAEHSLRHGNSSERDGGLGSVSDQWRPYS